MNILSPCKSWSLVAVGTLVCSLGVWWMAPGAQSQIAPRPGAGAPARSTPGEVRLRGDRTTHEDTIGVSRLSGNVVLAQAGEDFILYCDELTYSRARNQATATGNVRVETRDSTIRGARIFADFNNRVITFAGSVVISAHGRGNGFAAVRSPDARASLERNPVRIACDRLDWDYETREARLTGNLRMVQGDNVGTCDRIIYNEPRNIALLQGNVRFGDAQNRRFVTNSLTVFVDQNRVQSDDRIELRFPANPGGAPATAPRASTNFGAAREIDPNVLRAFEIEPPPAPPAPTPNEDLFEPFPVPDGAPAATPAPPAAPAAPAPAP